MPPVDPLLYPKRMKLGATTSSTIAALSCGPRRPKKGFSPAIFDIRDCEERKQEPVIATPNSSVRVYMPKYFALALYI